MCGPIGLCSDAISPIDIIIDEGFSHRRRDKPARRSLEVIREKAGRTAQYNGGDGEAEIEEGQRSSTWPEHRRPRREQLMGRKDK